MTLRAALESSPLVAFIGERVTGETKGQIDGDDRCLMQRLTSSMKRISGSWTTAYVQVQDTDKHIVLEFDGSNTIKDTARYLRSMNLPAQHWYHQHASPIW